MIDNFDIALGMALREARKRNNNTLQEVADSLGVTKMTVSHWECGKRSMTAKQLKQYCRFLGITVQSVIERT